METLKTIGYTLLAICIIVVLVFGSAVLSFIAIVVTVVVTIISLIGITGYLIRDMLENKDKK